jgi:DNA-binding transcriptional ArsR family regulator
MSLPAVTKHLKVLQRAGLITQGRQAQWRPCRLDAAPLRDIADWVEQYRRFWDESLTPWKLIFMNFKQRSRNDLNKP